MNNVFLLCITVYELERMKNVAKNCWTNIDKTPFIYSHSLRCLASIASFPVSIPKTPTTSLNFLFFESSFYFPLPCYSPSKIYVPGKFAPDWDGLSGSDVKARPRCAVHDIS